MVGPRTRVSSDTKQTGAESADPSPAMLADVEPAERRGGKRPRPAGPGAAPPDRATEGGAPAAARRAAPAHRLAIESVAIASLRPATYNPREMPAAEMERLKASLVEFGFLDPVVANVRNRVVIGGHQRMQAAKDLGLAEIPVVWVGPLDDARERAANLALNRIQGRWKEDALAEVLKAVGAIDGLLPVTGFTQNELDQLTAGWRFTLPELAPDSALIKDHAGVVDPEPPEPPDNPTTKRGDLLILGRHRLLCGDGGSAADLDRLLGGARVHLVHTDPPYNVNVEPRSNNAISSGTSPNVLPHLPKHHQKFDLARHPGKAIKTTKKMRAKDRHLQNDCVSDEAFATLLLAWFGNVARVLLPGRAFYVWGGYANIANYPSALKASGLYFAQSIIWHKLWPVLGRKDFMGDHEWCFYGWREGAAHVFVGPNNVPDVWPIRKVGHTQMVHLTEKPVALAVRAMDCSTRPGENVLDLFGGSGSTLIGAEQVGRTAYTMEIDPAYCDVIVARFEQLTGRKATRRRA